MSKVLVDPAALEEAAKWLEVHSSSSGSAEAFAAEALREAIAQPAEAEGVEVVAYATPGNDGDWQMLFFDEKEAFLYVDDERPAPLILQSDHLAALSAERTRADVAAADANDANDAERALAAVTAERDRLREDRDSQQRVCIAEMEKVSQLRAEVEWMRAQRDKMAQILRDLVHGCKWRFMRPRIDQALQEVDGGN